MLPSILIVKASACLPPSTAQSADTFQTPRPRHTDVKMQ